MLLCGGGSVNAACMYYSIHNESASLQEFFLLAHFIRCGGDSFKCLAGTSLIPSQPQPLMNFSSSSASLLPAEVPSCLG